MASATLNQIDGKSVADDNGRHNALETGCRYLNLRDAWTYGRFGHLRASARISRGFKSGLVRSPRR